MLHPLLAYDENGLVIATLDYVVARDADGNVTGLVDFAAHEAAGGSLTDIWHVSNATGSGTWPEWLGSQAHGFRVELGPDGRIGALVHQASGHRRERAAIEAAIAAVVPDANGVRDLRAILGGPGRPLTLDDHGRNARLPSGGTPAHLPVQR